MALKRIRGNGSRGADCSLIGTNTEDTEMIVVPSSSNAGAQSSKTEEWTIESQISVAEVLIACRAALARSPAASRTALSKHRASIDPALARTMEIVGSYTLEDGDCSLHESVRRGDLATTQSLIVAGINTSHCNRRCITPLELTTFGSPCRTLLEHHTSVHEVLLLKRGLLVTAALAYCAAPSSRANSSIPATVLALQAHQFDPYFLWAPTRERAAVAVWAQSTFIAQLVPNTEPFADLPDDCAADIVEYLKKVKSRAETMRIVSHCSTPEAHAWVRAVVVAAVAEMKTYALVSAAEIGDLATVQDCLTKRADVDFRNEYGYTALMSASMKGYTAIVNVLLQAGADEEAKKEECGTTALIYASKHGNTAIVKLLLEAGADIESETVGGFRALMYASMEGCTSVVEALLQAGANVNAKGFGNTTALIEAALYSNYHIAVLLLEARADKETKNEQGYTALEKALEYPVCDDLVYLLQYHRHKPLEAAGIGWGGGGSARETIKGAVKRQVMALVGLLEMCTLAARAEELILYSQDQEFVKRFSTRASAESTESTVMGGLAKKVASKLSSTEMKMKAIVQMTDRIKRLEASLGHAVEVKDDLDARLSSAESVKEFLVDKLKDTELVLKKTIDGASEAALDENFTQICYMYRLSVFLKKA